MHTHGEESNVTWGSVLKGAAIAGGVVAAIALFPASLGVVSAFIAANPILTVGGAAVAGGLASAQMAAQANRPDPIAQQLDAETFAAQEDIRRMETLMNARMQAIGMATGNTPGRS